MRHRKAIRKIGKPTAHRKALLRNLVTSFFQHGKVITTKARAKAAQQVAERLIRYSISGTLEDKRRIISYLKNRETAHKLIKLGAEKFKDAPRGGQTAIYKLGYRKGDGAEMAVLSLLIESIEKKKKKKRKKKEKVIEAVPKSEAKSKEELSAGEVPIEKNIEAKTADEVEEVSENSETVSKKLTETQTVEEEVKESVQEIAEPESKNSTETETPVEKNEEETKPESDESDS